MTPGVFLTLRLCASMPFFFLAALYADREAWRTTDALSTRNVVVAVLLGVCCFWANQTTFMYGLSLTTTTNAGSFTLHTGFYLLPHGLV